MTATYWHQTGQFEQLDVVEFYEGRSKFWLVDAAFNFRLPRRNGFFSVGVANLFDKEFDYYEVDFDNPTIQPKRTFYMRFTVAVP